MGARHKLLEERLGKTQAQLRVLIKQVRETLGLQQKKLALLLGINQQYVSMIESGYADHYVNEDYIHRLNGYIETERPDRKDLLIRRTDGSVELPPTLLRKRSTSLAPSHVSVPAGNVSRGRLGELLDVVLASGDERAIQLTRLFLEAASVGLRSPSRARQTVKVSRAEAERGRRIG